MKRSSLLLLAIFLFVSQASAAEQSDRFREIFYCYSRGAVEVLAGIQKNPLNSPASLADRLAIQGGPLGIYIMAKDACDDLLRVTSQEKNSQAYCKFYNQMGPKIYSANNKFWDDCKTVVCSAVKKKYSNRVFSRTTCEGSAQGM